MLINQNAVFLLGHAVSSIQAIDHVIMLPKNQFAHSRGSHLINVGADSCKLINHQIKPSIYYSAILVLFHPTSGYSEIHFYFEIHSEIAEIDVSGIINR